MEFNVEGKLVKLFENPRPGGKISYGLMVESDGKEQRFGTWDKPAANVGDAIKFSCYTKEHHEMPKTQC